MLIVRQLAAATLIAGAAIAAHAQDTVIYHVNDTETQALGALRNARNHLDTDPSAKITFVTHSNGVDFLMVDAKAKNGTEYAPLVAALKASGVKFEICEITLKRRKLEKSQFIQEADYTPSGVVRLTKLQKQGFAYIKP
jgi:intracellular sulfur oxidation DsrE/DsrF family protein